MTTYPFPQMWDDERDVLAANCAAMRTAVARICALRAEHIGAEADAYVAMLSESADAVGESELADVLARHGITWEMLSARLALLEREPFTYYAADTSTLVAGAPVLDAVRNRRKADGTVRGKRRGYVVDGLSPTLTHDGRSRADYATLTAEAHAMLMDAGDADLTLIGTDEYSWAQVIHWRPTLIVGADGIGRAARPSRGVPIVGDVYLPQNRKRAPMRSKVARYHVRPEEMVTNGWWPMAGARVIKRYRTTHDGRVWVGHRKVETVRAARKARTTIGRSAVVDIASREALVADAEPRIGRMFTDGTNHTLRYRLPDGTRVSITNDATNRRYRTRVSVASKDGTSATAKTHRTLAAAMRALR